MLRIIAGIIVGFIVMAVLVMITFIIPMSVMGLQNILKPDSYWTTDSFNIIVLIGGTIASIIGGLVCGLIARDIKAAFALATILIALGAVSVVTNMNKPDPPARTGDATLQDMQTHGKEPTWFSISKTVLGAVGVLLGAGMVKPRKPA